MGLSQSRGTAFKVNFSEHFITEKDEIFSTRSTAGRPPVNRRRMQTSGGLIAENLLKGKNYRKVSQLPDNRKKVSADTGNQYPHCAIGHLYMEFQGKPFSGTGCLIGKNIALTCAHNLYDRANKQEATNINFTPGLNGKRGNTYSASRIFYPEQYKTAPYEEAVSYDFGIICLNAPYDLSLDYGFMGINTSWGEKHHGEVNLYGYPGREEEGEEEEELDWTGAEEKLRYQFGQKKKILRVNLAKNLMVYDIYTSQGQSGSPIYIQSKQKGIQIVGVHVAGSELENTGVILSESVRLKVNQWIDAIKGIFKINNRNVGNEGIGFFMMSIEDNFERFTELHLANNRIGLDGIKMLTKQNWPRLKLLNLENNNLKVEGAKYLSEKNWEGLVYLNLSNTMIQVAGLAYMMEEKEWPVMAHLYLSRLDLGLEGVKILCKKKRWPFMETFHLVNNKITSEGMEIICQQPWSKIKDLNISENPIGNRGVELIVNRQMDLMQTLNLHKVDMDGEGCRMLFSKTWENIKSFRLDWNKSVSANGAAFISPHQIPKVIYFNVDWLTFGRHGMKSFMQYSWPNLKVLYIGYNYLGDDGLKMLQESKIPHVQDLSLQGNNITRIGIVNLVIKSTWKTLKILKLRNNKIDFEGIFTLACALKDIHVIDLHNNILTSNEKTQLKENCDKLRLKVHLDMDFQDDGM